MKILRFSSRPRAKVRCHRPLGSARVQPCHLSSVCYLTLFSFVFHSTVLYLSSLLISLPYSYFLLSFILLFYILSPLRLRCRGNLTPVSNVCEAAPKSLSWAPIRLNELPEMRFKFPFNLIGKSTMAFLTGQSWRVLQSWYTGEDLEQGFGAVSQTVLTRV